MKCVYILSPNVSFSVATICQLLRSQVQLWKSYFPFLHLQLLEYMLDPLMGNIKEHNAVVGITSPTLSFKNSLFVLFVFSNQNTKLSLLFVVLSKYINLYFSGYLISMDVSPDVWWS